MWTSPIYAFFKPTPDIEYVQGRQCHIFHCGATSCKQRIHHCLDKKDAGLTSNLHKHAESCWGAASVKAVTEIGNIDNAHASVKGLKEIGTIEASFKKKGGGKIKYWHTQHSKTETKYVLHT
jgi:hypothetical protein